MQEAGENLTLLAVKQGLAAGTLTVIDVREPAEFAAGHIPESRNLPLSHFDPTALPAGAKRLVFACQTGKRATLARERFVAAGGDPSAALFLAGYAGWLAAGETIAR